MTQNLDSTTSSTPKEDPGDGGNRPGAWPITHGVTDVRSLLAVLFSWLMPSTGKRRAPLAPTQHPLTDQPTQTLGVVRPTPRSTWPPLHAQGQDRFGVIVADGSPLVRPYVIQHEQERERQQQRGRCTALTLATIGIDFHGATA